MATFLSRTVLFSSGSYQKAVSRGCSRARSYHSGTFCQEQAAKTYEEVKLETFDSSDSPSRWSEMFESNTPVIIRGRTITSIDLSSTLSSLLFHHFCCLEVNSFIIIILFNKLSQLLLCCIITFCHSHC